MRLRPRKWTLIVEALTEIRSVRQKSFVAVFPQTTEIIKVTGRMFSEFSFVLYFSFQSL